MVSFLTPGEIIEIISETEEALSQKGFDEVRGRSYHQMVHNIFYTLYENLGLVKTTLKSGAE